MSLSTGTMVTEALRALGHRAGLIDLYFGLETGRADEAFFDAPMSGGLQENQPRGSGSGSGAARPEGDSPSMFGPRVLELCRMADMVFLALHGTCGEDGRVQAAFDLMGIPYTGAGYSGQRHRHGQGSDQADGGRRGVHPRLEDRRLHRRGHRPTGRDCPLAPGGQAGGQRLLHRRIHRPTRRRSCAGPSLKDWPWVGARCWREYIRGREIQVGILEDKALPSIEIIPSRAFMTMLNKYQPGAALEVCPAEITSEEEARVGRGPCGSTETLGLSVYSRADLILTEDGEPWFLEINTLPGMTPTSLLPQEAAAVGMDYAALCERILLASLEAEKGGRP